MARFVKNLVVNLPDDSVTEQLNTYLQENQFEIADFQGEQIYRSGDASEGAVRYFKWEYADGRLRVEAWAKDGYGREVDLSKVGSSDQMSYQESLEQLLSVWQEAVAEAEKAPEETNLPEETETVEDAEITEKVETPEKADIPAETETPGDPKAAMLTVVFGALCLSISFFSPLISVIFGFIGCSMAKKGRHSDKADWAKMGKRLCIVGMLIAVLVWFANMIFTLS